MGKLRCIGLVVLLEAVAPAVAQEGARELSLAFSEGTERTETLELEASKTAPPGGRRPAVSRVVYAFTWRARVASTPEDGQAVLEARVRRVRLVAELEEDGRSLSYDTERDPVHEGSIPDAREIAPLLAELVGRTFRYEVASGEVNVMDWRDAVSAAGEASGRSRGGRVPPLLETGQLRTALAAALSGLPEDSVRPGNSWTSTFDFRDAGATVEVSETVRFAGPTTEPLEATGETGLRLLLGGDAEIGPQETEEVRTSHRGRIDLAANGASIISSRRRSRITFTVPPPGDDPFAGNPGRDYRPGDHVIERTLTFEAGPWE